ncbi:helix-turn-helix transcriptional regulator [Clostridium botulinum C/D]|nr:helix-turn-helix transcriptional regulator [Clostridium botulinum C/D]
MALNFEFEICIKEFRLKFGISQEQLALKAGLSQGYVSKLESKDRTKSPTLNSVYRIAKVFKICPYRLIICSGSCDTCKLKYW